jgi:hypothetical protein
MKVITTEPILQAQIDDWKQQHNTNELHLIEVPLGDDENAEVVKGYFRNPTMSELSIATKASVDDKLKFSQVLYNTCLLGGHPLFEKNDSVIQSAMKEFAIAIKPRQAKLKKV